MEGVTRRTDTNTDQGERTLPRRTDTTTENITEANLSGYSNRQVHAEVRADPDPWWQRQEEWLCSPECHHLCLAFATLPKRLPSMMGFPGMAKKHCRVFQSYISRNPNVFQELMGRFSIPNSIPVASRWLSLSRVVPELVPHVRHGKSASSSISMRAQQMLILKLSTLLSARI